MTDALDIVNHNLADVAEPRNVCWQQMKTVQEAEEALGVGDVLGSGDGSAVQCTSVSESVQQSPTSPLLEPNIAECIQSTNSDASASSCTGEITCLTVDVGEMAASKNEKSSAKSTAALSAQVAKDERVVGRLFSDEKCQKDADSKAIVKLQKSVTSSTPKKTESTSVGRKVGSSSNVTPRQPALTARRSFDLNSAQSSAQLSSSVSGKLVDLTQRRSSVSKRTVKQPAMTGSNKQQTQTERKSSSASTSSSALLPGQKTNSESNLAAGDFNSDLPISTSVRSSTPVTSSVGDSNNTSRSISRVSSISDASSPSASHTSSGAFSAPVHQSTTKGKPQHLFMLLESS